MALPTDHQSRVRRFWSRVKKGGSDECWEWQGSKYCPRNGFGGYGKILWASKPRPWWRPAHRVAWELTHGLITNAKLCVCHTCDVPSCCNPKHLWLGTRKENNLDKQRKGRDYDRRGINNPRAKLAEKDVKKIRKLLSQGYTQTELGELYGVAQVQIWRIKAGITWKHVSE